MKLFGHPDSGHVYKVRFLLEAAGIRHDYEVVDIWAPRESRSHEFRTHSKFQEVPLLIDGKERLIQSNSILIYLAQKIEKYGAEDNALMTQCVEWLVWEANKIGMCLPQLRSYHQFQNHGINDGAYRWLMSRFDHDIQVIENELKDGRSFILGDVPTIADFSLSGYLFYTDEAHVEIPAGVSNWLANLSSLSGWKAPYQLLGSNPGNVDQ